MQRYFSRISRVGTNVSNRIRIGGDLQHSLTQGYRIDLRGLLTEGWTQTRRNGFGLLLAIVGVVAIWLLLTQWVLGHSITTEGEESMDLSLTLSLLITVIMAPMTAALDMLGVQQAIGVRARAAQVFDFFRHFIRLGTLSLLTTLMGSLAGTLLSMLGAPMLLVLLPTALLNMALLFSVPLLLERGMTPWQAIVTSVRLFLHGWPSLLVLHMVMLALFMLAFIPMGLGLLLVAPLYYNIKGILYRDLCGIAVEVSEAPTEPDHFNA